MYNIIVRFILDVLKVFISTPSDFIDQRCLSFLVFIYFLIIFDKLSTIVEELLLVLLMSLITMKIFVTKQV